MSRRDVLRGLIVAAALLAVWWQVPGLVDDARVAFRVSRMWAQADEQYRTVLGYVPYDLIAAADAQLPERATVLLVTSGADVRHREYETFHRALYFLTPRPVHWMNPAPGDGTWEARWWTTAPLTAESICAESARIGATHLLLVDVEPPTPACASVGNDVALLPTGAIVGVRQSFATPRATNVEAPRLLAGGLAALLIPFAIGAFIVARVGRGALHAAQSLALAWVIGTGVVTLADTWLGLLGIAPELRLGLLATCGLLATGLLIPRLRDEIGRRRRAIPSGERAVSVAGFTAIGALVGLVGLVGLVAVVSIGRPLAIWDGWASWAMKARTIFLEGRVTEAVYADPTRASDHLAYPLHVPALESWLFQWLGAADDRLVGLLSLATFVALLLFVYGTLRRCGASAVFSLAAVGLLGSVVHLWRISAAGFADVPLALGATVGLVLLVQWLEGGNRGVLVLGAVSMGLLPWVKTEGAVLLAIPVVLLVVVAVVRRSATTGRRSLAAAAACLVAGVVLAGWWAVFLSAHGIPADEYSISANTLVANADRVTTIVKMQIELLSSPVWSYIWPVAAVVGLTALAAHLGRQQRTWAGLRPIQLLPAVAGSYLVVMSAAYVFTTFAPYTEQIESSGFRLALHVLPITVIWLAVTLHELTAQRPARLENAQSSGTARLEAQLEAPSPAAGARE